MAEPGEDDDWSWKKDKKEKKKKAEKNIAEKRQKEMVKQVH